MQILGVVDRQTIRIRAVVADGRRTRLLRLSLVGGSPTIDWFDLAGALGGVAGLARPAQMRTVLSRTGSNDQSPTCSLPASIRPRARSGVLTKELAATVMDNRDDPVLSDVYPV